MPRKRFIVNDFSGGVNGFKDPQNIAENELAQCQAFIVEPGKVSTLGDMISSYTLGASVTAARTNIDIEGGYGLFTFSHDYDKDGDLNSTDYIVFMNGVLFDIFDTDGNTWQASQISLGALDSGSSSGGVFAGSVKPCFFIADGAFRISPGNFEPKDSLGGIAANFAATTTHGAYEAVSADSDLTDYLDAGDTIVIGKQEMVVLIAAATTLTASRNMTGLFPAATDHTDSATGADTISVVLDTRWRGVVQRKNFNKVTTIGTFTEWYSSFAHPRPPVTHNNAIDHDAVDPHYQYPFLINYSVADIGINATDSGSPDGEASPCIHVGYLNTESHDGGLWNGASITLYTTALYDEVKQESQPNKGDTFTIAAGKELGIWIGAEYSEGSSNYRMHKRVTGARVYYEDSTNDPGVLFQLIEIDFEKGCKKAGSEVFTDWEAEVADEACGCPDADGHTAAQRTTTNAKAFIFTSPPKVITYEINTGYQSHINTHARYKTATICNRRLFVGNVYQSGVAHGDRMISSPPNKFDILPETNFIDVAVGDGDEIVKLESFADRILQFKKRSLYIINAGGSLGQEYLESEHKNMGVQNPSQTCMTEFGVAWVNAGGVYLYDGKQVNDLTIDKLKLIDTTDRYRALNIIEDNIPSIGYHSKNKWLIIHTVSDIGTAFDQEAWIFDFKTGAWMFSQEFSTNGQYKTNMINTSDNELMFLSGTNSSDTPDAKIYGDSGARNPAQNKLVLLTKDYVLEAPAVKKKILKVYITYSTSQSTKIEASLLYQKEGATTPQEVTLTEQETSSYYDTTDGFKTTGNEIFTVELKPASSVSNMYSFQLKLINSGAAAPSGSFKLYNIQFLYRAGTDG